VSDLFDRLQEEVTPVSFLRFPTVEAADGSTRHGPFSAVDGLDDAITDAKRRGYKIAAVNRTRGMLPPVSPQPPTVDEQPKEVLSGDQRA
jgi:hypothetical protein